VAGEVGVVDEVPGDVAASLGVEVPDEPASELGHESTLADVPGLEEPETPVDRPASAEVGEVGVVDEVPDDVAASLGVEVPDEPASELGHESTLADVPGFGEPETPVDRPTSAGASAGDAAGTGDGAGHQPPLPILEDLAAQSEEEPDPARLHGAVEAILLVVDEPVSEVILAQILDVPTDRINAALTSLAAEYTEQVRGFDLRQAAGGWRLYTRGEYAQYVEKFVLDGQQIRLTQAALETLAVIAYKQPVTRSRISAIRGVNCDGVVRTLLARGLIEECGSEPDSGAFLYRTTTLFLEKLGLNSVDELPPLAPFLPDDVDAIANAES
jgi:segregation and condensation protein B